MFIESSTAPIDALTLLPVDPPSWAATVTLIGVVGQWILVQERANVSVGLRVEIA